MFKTVAVSFANTTVIIKVEVGKAASAWRVGLGQCTAG